MGPGLSEADRRALCRYRARFAAGELRVSAMAEGRGRRRLGELRVLEPRRPLLRAPLPLPPVHPALGQRSCTGLSLLL